MADATLVFVAGASPQIVTETVYRLADESAAITDVFILTTATGRELLRRRLLGRGGHWQRLLREYPRTKRFRLRGERISVLRDGAGQPLLDVRSSADNLAAADQIVRFVAEHTRDGAPPVHASIAGGRKTMGYLLAAAMTLYGRPADRLSHVLVHPPELEGTDFYFPPRQAAGRLSVCRPDGTVLRVRASEVRIDLADLPFPRLRAVVPAAVRERSFSDMVAELQSVLDALVEPRVSIFAGEHLIVCGDRPVSRRQLEEIGEREMKRARLWAYVTSAGFRERLFTLLNAADDLRNLQAEERKRHEALWGAQEEALSGIERLAGHIQGQVRAMVEGREA